MSTSTAFFGKKKDDTEDKKATKSNDKIDPKDAARLGMESLVEVSQDPLAMRDLMSSLNDPETRKEVEVLMKDPTFLSEIKKLKNDPQFICTMIL